jgi:hypothetical protein
MLSGRGVLRYETWDLCGLESYASGRVTRSTSAHVSFGSFAGVSVGVAVAVIGLFAGVNFR